MTLLERVEKMIGLEPERKFIFPRCASDTFPYVQPGRNPVLLTNIAVEGWLRESIPGNGRRRFVDILRDYFGDRPMSNLFQYMSEGIWANESLTRGDLMANGLRVALLANNLNTNEPSKFGIFLHEAYNDPSASHGHDHARKKERWAEAGVFGIRQLRHGENSIHAWAEAYQLDHYFHDADQMLLEHFNNANPDQKVSPKEGHEEIGAVMLAALRRRYQFESQISRHDSVRDIAGAIFMSFDHGEPEKCLKRLEATESALPYDFDPDMLNTIIQKEGLEGVWSAMNLPGGELSQIAELCQRHTNCQIDVRSLKLRQIFAIGLYKRLQTGFRLAGSKYGMLPSFEAEYETETLAVLKEDRNLEELLQLKGENDWQALCLAKEMNVRADVLEMKSHYIYSLFRTWSVKRAKERPWWRQELSEQVMGMITNGSGNAPKDKDSDVFRMLWEIMNEKMGEETVIGRSPFNQRAERETGILKLLIIKEIGPRIMRGNLRDIQTAYLKRRSEVTYKSLRTAGFHPLIINLLISGGKLLHRMRGIEVANQYFIDLLSTKSANPVRFLAKVRSLEVEKKSIARNFAQKPDGVDGVKIYPELDIASFNQVVDFCIQEFCQRYHVSKAGLLKYYAITKLRKSPSVTPFRFFDSLGGRIRTWMEPSPVALGELNKILFKA